MQGFTKTIRLLICLLFSVAVTRLAAQQPVLKVTGKDSARVKLKTYKVTVSVVGTTAITTMEMEFCSSAARVLEGELTFPMPDGVSISRYALDINGKMREAVPVEKEKGQVVFENIERRNVDPGLLEKTEGNNFRTRIYPIPANGCRKIIIGYEQQLIMTGSNVVLYDLPLHFKDPIAQFDISFKVFSKAPPEVGASCGTDMRFSQSNEVYNTAVSKPMAILPYRYPSGPMRRM
jgi:Vault protein inter-alpha-trypsin domain